MKFRLSLTILAMACTASLSSADVLTLKAGIKYKGKYISETEDSYLFQVQVTRSIKEERTFKKDEVESLEKDDPAELAYKEISKFRITQDMMSATDYNVVLEKIKSFKENHSASEYAKSVKRIENKITKESKKVSEGEIKLNGRWYSKSDQILEQLDFDAATIVFNAEKAISERNLRKALELLDEYEETFLGSSSSEETIRLKINTLRQYANLMETNLGESMVLQERRMKGLENLQGQEKKRTMKAVESESMAYKSLFEKEKKAGKRWLPLNIYSDKEIKDQIKVAKSEIARLSKMDLSSFPENGKMYKKAQMAIAEGNSEDAKEAATSLKSSKLAEKYQKMIEMGIKEIKTPVPTQQ